MGADAPSGGGQPQDRQIDLMKMPYLTEVWNQGMNTLVEGNQAYHASPFTPGRMEAIGQSGPLFNWTDRTGQFAGLVSTPETDWSKYFGPDQVKSPYAPAYLNANPAQQFQYHGLPGTVTAGQDVGARPVAPAPVAEKPAAPDLSKQVVWYQGDGDGSPAGLYYAGDVARVASSFPSFGNGNISLQPIDPSMFSAPAPTAPTQPWKAPVAAKAAGGIAGLKKGGKVKGFDVGGPVTDPNQQPQQPQPNATTALPAQPAAQTGIAAIGSNTTTAAPANTFTSQQVSDYMKQNNFDPNDASGYVQAMNKYNADNPGANVTLNDIGRAYGFTPEQTNSWLRSHAGKQAAPVPQAPYDSDWHYAKNQMDTNWTQKQLADAKAFFQSGKSPEEIYLKAKELGLGNAQVADLYRRTMGQEMQWGGETGVGAANKWTQSAGLGSLDRNPVQYAAATSAGSLSNKGIAPTDFRYTDVPETAEGIAAFGAAQKLSNFSTPKGTLTNPFQRQTYNAKDYTADRIQAALNEGTSQVATDKFFQNQNPENYMNPYQKGVTDVAVREARHRFNVGQNAADVAAQRAGAFGGYRQGIQSAEDAKNQAQLEADMQTKGLSDAFQQAQQMYGTDAARALAAGTTNAGNLLTSRLQNQDALNAIAQANQRAGLDANQQNIQNRQFAADFALKNEMANADYDTKLQLAELDNAYKSAGIQLNAAQLMQQLAGQKMQAGNTRYGTEVGARNVSETQRTAQENIDAQLRGQDLTAAQFRTNTALNVMKALNDEYGKIENWPTERLQTMLKMLQGV